MDYNLFIDGRWVTGGAPLEVKNKYTGETIAAVATARQGDVDAAISAALRAKTIMVSMPAHKRADILLRTAALLGEVIINDIPAFRADHMPYGGNRQSGLGREGVRFAMEDMTNIQMVAIRTAS